MNYTKHYLKFSSEEECNEKLKEVNFLQEIEDDGNIISYYNPHNQYGDIDIVGVINNDDGVFDEETLEEITPSTQKDGWHVNIIISGELPEELEDFKITPNSPYRDFA